MKEINVKRMEVYNVSKKLNVLLGRNKEDQASPAFITMLTLCKPSDKHSMPAGAPFPAIVKRGPEGTLAVYNCVTGKSEIVPEHSYKEPTPLGNSFEYKGMIYEKNPVLNLYTRKK
ncbi:MAG: hypothetical protein IJ545_04335 [Alphaproteobacteria bacterium]|nr:hypothetical protein [Alphaproteobacteria bacterium]